jgi:hypothetical protein
MKKKYIVPYTEQVILRLYGNLLENIGLGSSSKGADAGDAYAKQHHFDNEVFTNDGVKNFNPWED